MDIDLSKEKSETLGVEYGKMIREEGDLIQNEYLGTFRWKQGIKFPVLLPPNSNFYKELTLSTEKWTTFISNRVTFELEPFFLDAMSFPLTVISGLNTIFEKQSSFLKEKILNIVIIGASARAEERIALETNYFDEIYFYIKERSENNDIIVNIFFSGDEITSTNTYTSKNSKNLIYNFIPGNTGDYLKKYALDFSKTNVIFAGLNTGFGAGYKKLTISWIVDLCKILKFNFVTIFSYTNDYEDKVGELGIFEKLLDAKFLHKKEENEFKAMTTYKSEEKENQWSCANYGLYIIQGSNNKNIINDIMKMDKKLLEEKVLKTLTDVGIEIK